MGRDLDPGKGPDDLEHERRLFDKAIEAALTGYAQSGGTWELGRGCFTEALKRGARVDSALYEALDVAHEESETLPADAVRRFWDNIPVEEAINTALTGFTKDGGTWELGKWVFYHEMSETSYIDMALQTALEAASTEAESTIDEATEKFWRVIHPSYAAALEQATRGDIGDGVQLITLLHRPVRKDSRSGTYEGERAGQRVIVKQGLATELAREFEILSAVDYRGIPRVLNYHENQAGIGGLSRLTMEKLPGERIGSLLEINEEWKSKQLSEREAVAIADGLAGCFSALSEAGYIYRDLNMDHILVNKLGDTYEVSLVDVEGSSKKNEAGNAIADDPMIDRGTWETMAPEEFREGAELNEASSVFSITTILYQMLVGESPYYVSSQISDDLKVLLNASASLHERHVLVSYEGELGEVLRTGLDPDPSKRFQTLAAFRQALANAL